MAVNTPHKDYTKHVEKWDRCRDTRMGSDAVKAAGVKYLPQLGSHKNKPDRYEAYKRRALFYNAMGRTVEGLAGGIFQKEPKIEFSALSEGHEKDITLSGVPLELFAQKTTQEVLTTGRRGILVEMSDKESADQRPYWIPYEAEHIISWRVERRDGDEILTRVVLKEEVEELDPEDKDGFATKCIEQYRVLVLERAGDTDRYVQHIWRKVKKQDGAGDEKWEKVETKEPTRRGASLDFIPFTFVNASTTSAAVEKPPLDDLAVVNIHHYMQSADYKHGLHFTALPTPWVAGHQGSADEPIELGSGTALSLDANGSAGMLEFSGAGLEAIRLDLEDMKKMMATLGARLLDETAAVAETATAVGMRYGGEHATLRTIAGTIEIAISWCMKVHDWWMGGPEIEDNESMCELNKEFFNIKATPQQIQVAIAAWQAGAITFETFYYILQNGGWARDGVTAEEEKEGLDTEAEEEREQRITDIAEGLLPDPAAPPVMGKPPKPGDKATQPPVERPKPKKKVPGAAE